MIYGHINDNFTLRQVEEASPLKMLHAIRHNQMNNNNNNK